MREETPSTRMVGKIEVDRRGREVKGRGKTGGDRPRDPPDWLEIYAKRLREEAVPFA